MPAIHHVAARARVSAAAARSENLTSSVYRQLRADIVACRLLPGERIRVNAISEELGVSLGAVREALSRLTSEGLVIAEPNKGFRASPLSVADLRDLVATRVQLEKICVRQSLEHGDLDWETRVIAALHRLCSLEPGAADNPSAVNEAWSDAHLGFHQTLVSACGSPWLLRFWSLSWAQSQRYGRLTLPIVIESHSGRDPDAEHRAIATAMLTRDSSRAQQLMTAHIENSAAVIFRAIETGKFAFPGS